MKTKKIILPLTVVAAMALTTGVTQAKDGPGGRKQSLIEIVVFGKGPKAPPRKHVAPPKKIVVVKKHHPGKAKGHDKKSSKKRH